MLVLDCHLPISLSLTFKTACKRSSTDFPQPVLTQTFLTSREYHYVGFITPRNEQIVFPSLDITVNVACCTNKNVRLAIEAPRHIRIVRGELDPLDQTPVTVCPLDPRSRTGADLLFDPMIEASIKTEDTPSSNRYDQVGCAIGSNATESRSPATMPRCIGLCVEGDRHIRVVDLPFIA